MGMTYLDVSDPTVRGASVAESVRMGFIKDNKTSVVHTQATRARAEGRTVFVARLNTPALDSGFTGSLAGVAEMIEAVEAAGWRMENMSYSQDKHGKAAEGYFMFRLR